MKPLKIFLRYWFAFTTILSFIGGWIILAHSPKPVQPTTANNSTLPQSIFPPVQNPGNGSNNGFGFFSTGPQSNFNSGQTFPRIRTGGS